MKPRCDGNRPGVYLSGFICCLDADHDGRCRPYQPPTVDEWRARNAAEAELERGLREALAHECGRANRLERELREAKLVEFLSIWASGVNGPYSLGADLDAQVIAAVQRERKG